MPTSAPVNPSGGPASPVSPAEDADMLAVLGYEQKFDRKVGLWGDSTLGFVYLSPAGKLRCC
ncbi:hypothetical protein [Streptomyces sp. CA-179760]|uniref:hypothetical protein n=1 Tax=Streptomyces sp. CA-179760 TaxID=3240054 RepID=UPI003D93F1D6